jgi:hypothetical protein
MFAGPREVTVELVPAWAGDVPDEVPAASWFAVHAMRVDGGAISIIETGEFLEDAEPRAEHAIRCRARHWSVGNVVLARSYAPDIELALRGSQFGVLAGDLYELTSAEAVPGTPRARPAQVVPAFSCWFEPRIDGLTGEDARAIRDLSITTDEHGNLITRPDGIA